QPHDEPRERAHHEQPALAQDAGRQVQEREDEALHDDLEDRREYEANQSAEGVARHDYSLSSNIHPMMYASMPPTSRPNHALCISPANDTGMASIPSTM